MLFAYKRRFDETLRPGAVYWPGENIKRFGLQVANIEPIQVSDRDDFFEFGEVIALDTNGRARKIAVGDTAVNFHGVVHKNASATMGVLETQVMGMAPRLTLSIFRGGRQGVIAVPLQSISNWNGGTATEVPVVPGNPVFIRVATSTDNPALPIGGIETSASDGECVEWVGVKFAEKATTPYRDDTQYTDANGATTYVAGIELG